ncbi:DUF924 family protein [Arenicella xantha]|uniref:Uncharacterized protein (DUF924 family) n=1 Tax=Arenicella xantha TaxID=644221 RepID=A0A395JIL4_9GAMM|nr:DUF924 family protein [Arenicella xantha]RBP48787.1 uncharacterized protein (DUF924 family) [Arenicella xantha]
MTIDFHKYESHQAVLDFWFDEIEPQQRWRKDAGFDELIRTRFADVHFAASQSELFTWRETVEGRVAEIIVLDQFSRNLYRDSARAFACDAMALVLAQEAVAMRLDQALSRDFAQFLYMPYMHSESILIHDQALGLFEQLSNAEVMEFEIRHRDIIRRFGRYPHRNAILGRPSSVAELAFLEQPGSSF